MGIPEIYYLGNLDLECSVAVMELLGPSLHNLFNKHGRIFSFKTVLMIGIQMVLCFTDHIELIINSNHLLLFIPKIGLCTVKILYLNYILFTIFKYHINMKKNQKKDF